MCRGLVLPELARAVAGVRDVLSEEPKTHGITQEAFVFPFIIFYQGRSRRAHVTAALASLLFLLLLCYSELLIGQVAADSVQRNLVVGQLVT